MARVMIAEDSEAVRLVLKDSLKIGHHEIVAEAVDGIEAIKKFNETNPDILLLDVAMPQKDGITALKEIMSSNPDAKIIMITADETFSTIHQSAEDGAQAYIVKPFRFEDVLTAITMALN
ncbi:MAG: response regulator [Thaumarchaeota archaeon]|nr:response regulator [Nitrososphaerota archaeon]